MTARDSFTIVCMMLVNAMAWVSSRRLLGKLLGDTYVWNMVAGQIVLIWGAIAGAAFGLNAVGCLSPWSVYGGVLFLSLCGVTVTRIKFGEKKRLEVWCEIEDLRKVPVASVNGSVKNVHSSDNSIFVNAINFAKRIDWFIVGMTMLLAVGITQVALFGIVQFPNDWDTMAYHLPIVDHWIQTGQLSNQRCAFWYVPGNSELLAYWFTAPLSGDFWAQLNNVPVAVLLAVSLVAIAKMWRMDQKWQFMLVVLAAGCQPMIRQLTSLENDLGGAALFVSSLLFGIRWVLYRQTIELWLFAAAAGLLAGIKYYSIGYSAVSIGAIIAASWCFSGRRIAIRTMLVSMLGFTFLGSYWYVRNYWLTGSPLFPLGMEAIGIPDQWESMRPESETSTLLRGSTFEIWRLLLKAWLFQAGPITLIAMLLSPLFGLIGLFWSWKELRIHAFGATVHSPRKTKPSALAAEVNAFRMPQRIDQSVVVTFVLSLIVLGCIAVYVVTPNVIETDSGSRNMLRMQYHSVRFGYCLGVVSLLFIVKAFSLFDRWLSQKNRSWCTCFFVGAISVITISTLVFYLLPQYGLRQPINRLGLPLFRQPRLDYSAIEWGMVTIDVFLATMVAGTILKSVRFRLGAIGLVFISCTPWLSHHWHQSYEPFYSDVSYKTLSLRLRALAKGKPFCICDYRYYALLGSDRSGKAYRPLFLPNSESFRDYLVSNKCAIVAVPFADSHWSKTYEKPKEWIRELPNEYRKMEEADRFLIYEAIDTTGAKE